MNITHLPPVSGDGLQWPLQKTLQNVTKFTPNHSTIIKRLVGVSLITLTSLQVAKSSVDTSSVAREYLIINKTAVSKSLAVPSEIVTVGASALVANAQTPDYQPLAEFYNSTNGSGWTNKAGWLSGSDPCTGNGGIPWAGLGCINGRVTEINLSDNQLSGGIPVGLSALSDLQVLYLNNNRLSGGIPADLGEVTSLMSLGLENNQLNGHIPANLSALKKLRYLSIDNNQLSGIIPSGLSALTDLQFLSLSGNQLSGNIPTELGALTGLRQLSINNNQLSGSIPSGLSALINLQFLSLSDNQLSGAIPVGLGALTDLQYLSLNNNQLAGDIPAGLGALNSLVSLALDNNQLSGSIPVTLSALTNLQFLSLSGNQLSGSIPDGLGALTSLQYLFLYDNQLSGRIPDDLGALTNLLDLLLENNQLSGYIPGSLGALTSLRQLSLSNNQLSGRIPPSLGAITNLQILHLSNNRLSGSIPASLGAITGLQYLYLSDNQLSGSIPVSLGILSDLQVLSLADNQLTGSIPANLGALSGLLDLQLQNNRFRGCYPADLSAFCSVPSKNFSNNIDLPGGGSTDGFAAFCSSGLGSDAFVAQATASTPNACVGGVVSLSANGGNGYGYAWSGPPGSRLSSSESRVVTATLNAAGRASFSVVVSSGGSCSSTATVSVMVNPVPKPTITSLASSYCKNADAITLTGTPTGGQFMVDEQAVAQLDPASLSVGNHTVRYTVSVSGCTGTASSSATVAINPLPTLTPGPDQSVFLGYGSNCAQITATASGGSTVPGGTYSYTWNQVGSSRDSLSGQTVTACPSKTTAYLVRATDAKGCTSVPAQVGVSVQDVRCGPGDQFLTVCHYNVSLCVEQKVAERYLSLGARLGGCGTDNARLPAKGKRSDLLQSLLLTAHLNPIQNAVRLQVRAPQAGLATFEIFDLTGRTRQSHQEELTVGMNQVELRLDTLPTGLYMIRAGDGFNRQAAVRFGKP